MLAVILSQGAITDTASQFKVQFFMLVCLDWMQHLFQRQMIEFSQSFCEGSAPACLQNDLFFQLQGKTHAGIAKGIATGQLENMRSLGASLAHKLETGR